MKKITNMKRAVTAVLLAVFAALSFASCVKDEEPIFKESASVRLQNALKNAQDVLVGAENGWIMYYYPDPAQSYGGYVYTMKFTKEEVEVWSELFDGSTKSLYKMATDDGPVLSFDTNNYNFHFFATPAGSSTNLYGVSKRYQAFKGDFDFLILSATKDEVVLKGKRSGNKIVMHPIAAGKTPESVMAAVCECSESLFVSSYTGTVGNAPVEAYLYLGNRWMSIVLSGEQSGDVVEEFSADIPFAYTETGIRFYEPIELGSHTITGFDWVEESMSLVAVADAKESASLAGILPANWHAYDDFIGDYDLVYNDNGDWWSTPRTVSVSIVPGEVKNTYLLKGVNENYDLQLIYDRPSGGMQLMAQIIAEWGENLLLLGPCSGKQSASGGLSWSGWASTSYGMNIMVNEEKTAEAGTLVAEFSPGPSPSASQPINMFALIVVSPSGSFVQWGSGNAFKDYFPFNYRYYAPFWVSITKK